MSTARKFIYGTLVNYMPLLELVGEADPRIFAKKSMTSATELYPFIVYKLGNDTSEGLAEDQTISRQFFQVWVHDKHDRETGDYERIDNVIKKVKEAFKLAGSASHKVWTTLYLETSQDLNDDTMNTLFRYIRFQLIKED